MQGQLDDIDLWQSDLNEPLSLNLCQEISIPTYPVAVKSLTMFMGTVHNGCDGYNYSDYSLMDILHTDYLLMDSPHTDYSLMDSLHIH